jgi:hypothetical protein
VEVSRVEINEMKINGKNTESNVDLNDGRVGWKYPLKSKEISDACENFFKKRGMKRYTITGKEKNDLPEMQ